MRRFCCELVGAEGIPQRLDELVGPVQLALLQDIFHISVELSSGVDAVETAVCG